MRRCPTNTSILDYHGASIPLDELRYWSVARQEPYVDAAASLEAERRAGSLGR